MSAISMLIIYLHIVLRWVLQEGDRKGFKSLLIKLMLFILSACTCTSWIFSLTMKHLTEEAVIAVK